MVKSSFPIEYQGLRVEADEPGFESTVWWPIPAGWGAELGDAWEVRRPDPGCPGAFVKAPLTVDPDGRLRFSVLAFTVSLAAAVASIIHGPRPDGLLVRHLNDDKTNDFPSNIAYGTQAENIADSLRNGTFPVGERNGRAKLTAGDVMEIRALWAAGGQTKVGLARRFKIDQSVIRKIIKRELWVHVA